MAGASDWPNYHPQTIEPRWQRLWEEDGVYRTLQSDDRPKYYCLDFFPYPSADGLHVGHCRNYVPTDVMSRFRRMQGYNVLHPMGWDAFGEPAEMYAVKHNISPQVTTRYNTANFKRQFQIIGASYDWEREINSSDPEYYRWTQWFFLLLYRRGLAYRSTNRQWWCPTCQTTLSSHEVAGGVCWRGHTGLTRREIPAWYFRITTYADELLNGLDELDWPEPIKSMQRNWIGRSEGCQVIFRTVDGEPLPVFTTRPDTLFGVTFFVLAPEHPAVQRLVQPEQRSAVEAYLAEAARRSEIERMQENREKTGVFTGSYVTHPLSGAPVPVWVADYVLPDYGSGAVMGVPAHDERDFAFARQMGLPIVPVIAPPAGAVLAPEDSAYAGEGWLVNSPGYDGLESSVAAAAIAQDLERRGLGQAMVTYRMHDWLISRQRYWGTPIPIIHCARCGQVPVPEEQLPVLLPEMDDFMPDGSGRAPLERVTEFVDTPCPQCGGPAERETDTMGGFACSSWYFLRFANPHYSSAAFDPDAVKYWMPVDLYVGGAEHAVLHLLYARFWTRVLADAGLLSFREPFTRLLNQGQLMGPDGQRMSKSRGNVITPDSMVETYGADALRVYELFMAPFEQDVPWSTDGIQGARRFLTRVWNLYAESYAQAHAAQDGNTAGAGAVAESDPDLARLYHQTVRHVTERINGFRFNTTISALMELTNALGERQRAGKICSPEYYQALEGLLCLLAPIAPHIASELWERTGHPDHVHRASWPTWDAELAREAEMQIAVQVNGKVREVIALPAGASQAQVQNAALQSERVQTQINQRPIARIIYVPGKIVNVVVDG